MAGQISDLVAAGTRIAQSKAAQQKAAQDIAATLTAERRPAAPAAPDDRHGQARQQ